LIKMLMEEEMQRTARILVIDDEPVIRELLLKMLEREGYETITASDGKDGLRIFRENPTDIIITDLIMPEKEGLETIMELRRDFKDVKVIAMSGGGVVDSDTYLHIAKTLGAIETISKPFNQKNLLKTVQELLE
jgi:DNA-binding NtrC family response regulator